MPIAYTFLYEDLKINSIKDPQLQLYLQKPETKARSYKFDFICFEKGETIVCKMQGREPRQGRVISYLSIEGTFIYIRLLKQF